MRIDFWSGDALGKRRNQEDWHETIPSEDGASVLMVLADGMGGEAAGEVASKVAGATFVETFLGRSDLPIPTRLLEAMQNANVGVATEIEREPQLEGMGTTLLAAYLANERLHWISVGDSRLILVSNGVPRQLNADHSYGCWLDAEAAAGRISASAANSSPDRNALMSCVTGDEIEHVELTEVPVVLGAGDILLAASDGLDSLTHAAIAEVIGSVREPTASTIGSRLFEAIAEMNRPHQDNTTVIVARLVEA